MNLIIFGPQGSGKGTQAELLSAKFSLVHIETGQIFREIAREQSSLGLKIKELNERKEMIPDDITVSVIAQHINNISSQRGIILDSAPRTGGQVNLVEKMLENFGRSIDKAIYISLPYDESVTRITRRYACMECYKHLIMGKDIVSKADRCPACGAPVHQRTDDTLDGIAKRLETFYAVTMPVIEQYRAQGILIEVDGNQDREKVFEEIIAKIEN